MRTSAGISFAASLHSLSISDRPNRSHGRRPDTDRIRQRMKRGSESDRASITELCRDQRGGASDRINREPVTDSRSECRAPLSPFGERVFGGR